MYDRPFNRYSVLVFLARRNKHDAYTGPALPPYSYCTLSVVSFGFLCLLVATAAHDGALSAAEHVLLMSTGCAAVQSRHTGVSSLVLNINTFISFFWLG